MVERKKIEIRIWADLNIIEDDDFDTPEGKFNFDQDLKEKLRALLETLSKPKKGVGYFRDNLDFEIAYDDEGRFEYVSIKEGKI